jgi:hypothetical protein
VLHCTVIHSNAAVHAVHNSMVTNSKRPVCLCMRAAGKLGREVLSHDLSSVLGKFVELHEASPASDSDADAQLFYNLLASGSATATSTVAQQLPAVLAAAPPAPEPCTLYLLTQQRQWNLRMCWGWTQVAQSTGKLSYTSFEASAALLLQCPHGETYLWTGKQNKKICKCTLELPLDC